MKKWRIVILDRWRGRDCALRVEDGRLTDLLVDPDGDIPLPGAIYRAKTLRPMKGQGGLTLDLGNGHTGYLRHARGIGAGETMLVQVSSTADPGKAVPVSPKPMFRSRYAIVTPGAPGRNVARKIRDDDERDRLAEIAHDGMEGASDDLGLILRSECAGVENAAITQDLSEMRQLAEAVMADGAGEPELLVDAPGAAVLAWRDWPDPDDVVRDAGALETLGFADRLDELLAPHAAMPGGGWLMVEPTTALVAVDVNTGADTSFAAGLKANLAAAREVPRQLRLRGLGGQIVIDMAPMPHKERRQVEDALRRALRADDVETAIVGWTGLGHLELQRKRARLPLREAIRS